MLKKLWCHNCHYCNNRCLIREDHKANNWVTPSNRLRRRRSDAPRLWPAWRRLTFPFLSFPRKKVISLPQRPLCTIGNWREDNAGAGGVGVKRARWFCGRDATTGCPVKWREAVDGSRNVGWFLRLRRVATARNPLCSQATPTEDRALFWIRSEGKKFL